ncbi:MAG TPA: toprim domain-containing protein [Nanoarchaeota archaeon]|nr:toprim domain-containing protein [Nanoarchaeota archaeon]
MDMQVIEDVLKEIETIKENNTLVIVEGSNDKKALEELGVSNIIILNGKPLYRLVESITAKEAIILTDLDEEGKKLYHNVKHELQQKGVRINDRLRLLLFKTELRQIEGLANYIRRITNGI